MWKKQILFIAARNLPFRVIVCRKVGSFLNASGFLALILAAFTPMVAGQQLSLPIQSAGVGGSLLVSASFTPGPDPVSGLQFDLQYDSSAMSLVAIVGDPARAADKSLYYSDLNPNERRFVVAGLNQNPIPAGALFSLFILVTPNASSSVHPLTLTNLSGVNQTGSSTLIAGVSGSVSVDSTAGSQLQPAGVLNAASLESGSVAPGEIVTVIGSSIGPAAQTPGLSATGTAFGGTSVLFDGNPAPLLYAAPNQINAIVPFEISGQDVTQLLITNNGQVVAGLPLPVSAAAPAIFTLDASGGGQGAILNQDLSLNSQVNPADRGSIVVIYATGAGQTDPPGVDGQVTAGVPPLPTLPVSVQISGIDAEVLYAGAAPGLVAGVLQVNCRVPGNALAGPAPIQLIIGTARSSAGVTVALR